MQHAAYGMQHQHCDAKRGGGDHQLRLDCQRRQLNLLNSMSAMQHCADRAASAKKIGFDKRARQVAFAADHGMPHAVWCSGPMARGEVRPGGNVRRFVQTSARASMKTACVRACVRTCIVCVNGWVRARISARMRASVDACVRECARASEREWMRACAVARGGCLHLRRSAHLPVCLRGPSQGRCARPVAVCTQPAHE